MSPIPSVPEYKGFRCALYFHPEGWWGEVIHAEHPTTHLKSVRFIAAPQEVEQKFREAVDSYLAWIEFNNTTPWWIKGA